MEHRSTFIYLTRPIRPGYSDEMLPEEAAAMQAHVAFLNQKLNETTFHMIGPCLDRAFGLAIFEAASLEAAHQLMEHDPAVERGVLTSEIHPFLISYLPSGGLTSMGRP